CGSISSVDREGRPYQFPLVSLSIGVVNNQIYMPHSIQEVSYLAAEAKRHAKQSTSNISCISPQYDKAHPESISSATSSSPFPSAACSYLCYAVDIILSIQLSFER